VTFTLGPTLLPLLSAVSTATVYPEAAVGLYRGSFLVGTFGYTNARPTKVAFAFPDVTLTFAADSMSWTPTAMPPRK
jgi:hypothetical protein